MLSKLACCSGRIATPFSRVGLVVAPRTRLMAGVVNQAKPERAHPAPPALSVEGAAKAVTCARGLFFGKINAHQAFPFPKTLDPEQKEFLNAVVDPIEKFYAQNVDSRKIDESMAISEEILQGLKDLGLYGLQIPEEYGGLGLNDTQYARIIETLGADASIGVTLLAHQSIGMKGILLFGTDAQKKKYLPKFASGEYTACFALTEPSSGSDAAAVKTTAVLSPDGKHYLLNGDKVWITNGGIADIFTVFAQIKDEATGKNKLTAFIVEKGEGLSTGPPEHKCGIRGSNTVSVFFSDCMVPVENVLGEVGGGFKVAMYTLNNGRFGVGASSGAVMRSIIDLAIDHARERKLFGAHISSFGAIKDKIGRMCLEAYAIESMAFLTTGFMDRGEKDCSVEAAICKVFGSEALWRVCHEGIQILGGMGYMQECPLERNMRDARILSIFEGTSEILRTVIALTGMKHVGDRLNQITKVATNPRSAISSAGVLASEASARISHKLGLHRLNTPYDAVLKDYEFVIDGCHEHLRPAADDLVRATELFGSAVEGLLLKHGKKIATEQMALMRVANIAIDLYATVAVLSRATAAKHARGADGVDDLLLANAWTNTAMARVRENLAGLELNNDRYIAEIATRMCDHGKYQPAHPLTF